MAAHEDGRLVGGQEDGIELHQVIIPEHPLLRFDHRLIFGTKYTVQDFLQTILHICGLDAVVSGVAEKIVAGGVSLRSEHVRRAGRSASFTMRWAARRAIRNVMHHVRGNVPLYAVMEIDGPCTLWKRLSPKRWRLYVILLQ